MQDIELSAISASRTTLANDELPSRWGRALAEAIRDPDTLCDLLSLDESVRQAARRAAQTFGLFVPRSFVARMVPRDPDDPLLRQVLPINAELQSVPGFTSDPVGDMAAQRSQGLLHKYAGRALLITTGVCAVHCRYCFRRHFPYAEQPRGLEAWEPALAAIAADRSIEEVLLSGGDPLTLTDAWLEQLVERLAAIEHLQRLRIHSRLPIVLPERIDERLIGWLRRTRLTPILVVHANHPQELVTDCAAALGRLVDAGVVVLNQAVLLRGVNDTIETLTELCRRLINLRVIPYYLHQLDRVAGAAHFEVDPKVGLALMAQLRERLPGYAIPRYVREQAGAAHKLDVEDSLVSIVERDA